MQTRHTAIIDAINNNNKRYNVLTFCTHESYWSNMASSPHAFYMWQGKNIKPWNPKFRELPNNHILLDGSENQIKPWMKFDIVLSQNKFGQFPIAAMYARQFNIPLISLEHTLPMPTWKQDHLQYFQRMTGKINLFISEYSVKQWGFDLNDPTVKVLHHGIDTDLFNDGPHNDGRILSVVNDFINRDRICGFAEWKNITDGLPVNPVGNTPNLSNPATSTEDLVNKYKNASVFINTSLISPIPMSLLEAMSCGCPVVTTATCMIPEIVQDGYNGFISNDIAYLRERVQWCLSNPKDAWKLGQNARKTIVDRFSLSKHLQTWNDIFDSVYGRGF